MKTATIYKIINKKNGYVYIGQTIRTLDERLKGHFRDAKRGITYNRMYEDMRTQPREDFQIEKIVTVDYRIRFMIEKAHTKLAKANGDCYNISEGNSQNFLDETKKKISATLKGRTLSNKTKKKISAILKGENNPNFGKTFSDEHKAKLSAAKQGENHPNFGKTLSEETRAKMSLARKAYWAKRRLEKQDENQVR